MAKKALVFVQDNCAPCDEAKPRIQEAERTSGAKFEYIDLTPDIHQHPNARELVQQYRVKFTPTVVVVDEDTGDRRGSLFGKLINAPALVGLLQS